MSTEQSPSDEQNQEPAKLASDTISPPPNNHGWLEQFEAFGGQAFSELEKVALQGFSTAESELLIVLAAKLIRLAEVHDKDSQQKLISLLNA